jgi:RNA polymerase sigma-70 factor (ECF subfamily)
VFLECARGLQQSKLENSALLAWLYTVAQRRLVDAARKAFRRNEVGLDDAPGIAADDPPEYGQAVARALERGLRELDSKQRDVVVMKLMAGRTFAEVAELTGASEGACRMRFLRGLGQLRDYLTEEGLQP